MSNKLNFIFWGTPDVARDTLEILKENGYMPSLIVSSPDKPQGRKMILTPPPTKVWAIENKIPYIQPGNLKEGTDIVFRNIGRRDGAGHSKSLTEDFRGDQNIPDLFIVVAYGKIMSEEIINMPKFGSINIHYSLLPKYRGASPVESAILNGDTKTGVTIQQMKYKMDSGPIIAQEEIEILPAEKAPELRKRLIKIGGYLLVKILNTTPSPSGYSPLASGELIPQDESKATFCKKIKKEDGLINLNDDPIKNYNKFRAYATWPRTYFFQNSKRIIITDAILEDKKFIIKKIIPEGKKETDY